jgi:hypothetical protein
MIPVIRQRLQFQRADSSGELESFDSTVFSEWLEPDVSLDRSTILNLFNIFDSTRPAGPAPTISISVYFLKFYYEN